MGNYQEKWARNPNDPWRFFESSLPRVLAVRSVWLFIDALDECGEINAKDGQKLRICFSCRHYPILRYGPNYLPLETRYQSRSQT
ncbi:hypothetical protein V8C34DRAFT_291027 [Trichoderma compactum]